MNISELELIERKEEKSSDGDTIITTYYKCPCQQGKVVEICKNGLRNIVVECDICKDSYKNDDID